MQTALSVHPHSSRKILIMRKLFSVIAAALLFSAVACAETSDTGAAPIDGVVPMGVQGEAEDEPRLAENHLVVVNDKVNGITGTTGDWQAVESNTVFVAISIEAEDWDKFLEQLDLNENIIPSQVQLFEKTAASLIDIDELAEDLRNSRAEVDIEDEEVNVYFDLRVNEPLPEI